MVVKGLVCVALATLLMSGTALAQQKIEVMHWQTGEANAKKLAVVANALKEQGYEWQDNAIAAPDVARSTAVNRLLAGDAPEVFQYNAGGGMDELAAQGLLRPLDDIANEENWASFLPAAALDAMTYEGHIYAVPFSTLSINWLWYNVAEFKAMGLEEPTTWEEILADSKKFEEAGKIGLALSNEDWANIHLFLQTMPDVAGPEVYKALYLDRSVDAARSPEFRKAAETYVAIRDAADPAAAARTWQDASTLVFTGKAAMQHLGDWYKGAVIGAGLTPGVEIGCVPAPGLRHSMTDAVMFMMPVTNDPAIDKAQDAFVRTIISKQVQVDAAKVDGGTPARIDVDPSTLDLCVQKLLAMDPALVVPGDTWLAPGFDMAGAIFDIALEVWGNKSLGADDIVDRMVKVMERFPKT